MWVRVLFIAAFLVQCPQSAELKRPRLFVEGGAAGTMWQKIEFEIDVPVNVSNPYDPDEIKVDLRIETPTEPVTVPAFFYQAFEYRALPKEKRTTDWIYPVGGARWKGRFFPPARGTYRCKAVAQTKESTNESNVIVFTCSDRKEPPKSLPVHIRTGDGRFFILADGQPFFPIGHNIAFIGESQYVDLGRVEEIFGKLESNGANFARIWAGSDDWAMAIEARKSAWSRSWDWRPPLVPLASSDGYHREELLVEIGEKSLSVSPSHPVAVKPGTNYRMSGEVRLFSGARLGLEHRAKAVEVRQSERKKGEEWSRFEYDFSTGPEEFWLGELKLSSGGKGKVLLRDMSLRENGAPGSIAPNLLWEADPNRPPRGCYNQFDSFMLDRLLESAEKHGIYIQLCLLTRDNYRYALRDPESAEYRAAIESAQKLLRYAVARWGYSCNVMSWEYFNEMDPGAPTGKFYEALGEYLDANDPYRKLRMTSAWSPAPKDWANNSLDVADLHWYLRPTLGESWKNEIESVLERAHFLRERAPAKPAMLGEFGLANDAWGLSPYMAQDKNHVHFHNILWASALSGLSGTAHFWWWDTLDQGNAYGEYKGLAEFVKQIPFSRVRLESRVAESAKKNRVVLLEGPDQAYGWLVDRENTWWKRVVEKTELRAIENDSLGFSKIQSGDYKVRWWNTRNGMVLGEESAKKSADEMMLTVPAFKADVAFSITPDK